MGFIPKNPIEFLRYNIYKTTSKTLLIKDKQTIEAIKENAGLNNASLFIKYRNRFGLEGLSEIFYRFKPLFLAFKEECELKPVINKIRKLAIKNHKPLPEDYLNAITSKLKNGKHLNIIDLREELNKVNTFRKIRLAYALKFRLNNPTSIVYKVRNGKSYSTEFSFRQSVDLQVIFDEVLRSIILDISKNVAGKKVYIPKNLTYALPSTEKQFTGNLPTGTCISVTEDMIFGVHWENVNRHRIDLDLSLINAGGKIGWDSAYRNNERSILFSGDITDAPKPKGATELFYVQKNINQSSILLVNYYNYDEDVEVPFKILVAEEKAKNFKSNYMVNPNNVKAVAKTSITQKQKMLGLLDATEDGCKFYFVETSIGNSIYSSRNEYIMHSKNYLSDFYKNTINLNDVLQAAGAEIVDSNEECDIDLSYETLEKDTILNLLIKKEK